jgi:hypothetical protein
MLAIVGRAEFASHQFVSPDLVSGSFRVPLEVQIPLRKILINSQLGGVNRGVVAVVNNRLRHTAEHRLYHI